MTAADEAEGEVEGAQGGPTSGPPLACSCHDEDEWGSPVEPPSDPHCPLHGERPVADVDVDDDLPTHMIPEGADGGPPMPTPPDHDCDPEALTIHPDHGWACTACGLILGGDQAHATTEAPDGGPGREPAHEPQHGAALARRDPIGAAIRTLDPTKVQGPQQCHEEILYIIERLSQAEYAQRSATHEKADAETAFRRAYDRAVVERRGQGSADVRAAEARIQADAELERLETAKAVEAAIKGAAHSWRSMLSGYQTAARLVEASYQSYGRN